MPRPAPLTSGYVVALCCTITDERDIRAIVATWADATALARHLLAPGEYLDMECMSDEPGDTAAWGIGHGSWTVNVDRWSAEPESWRLNPCFQEGLCSGPGTCGTCDDRACSLCGNDAEHCAAHGCDRA